MPLIRTFSPPPGAPSAEARTPQLTIEVWTPAHNGYAPVTGVIDSGSDVSIISHIQAKHLGLEVDDAEALPIFCADGSTAIARPTAIPLHARILHDPDPNTFSFHPYVVDGARTNLWGIRDFFRAFDVQFRFSDREIILTPVPS